MNTKKIALTSLAVFVFIFIFEFIFHGCVLKSTYDATAHLWRPKAEMGSYMPFMTLGQIGFATLFTIIFTHGYKGTGIMEGVRFGLLIGIFTSFETLIWYSVVPYPVTLVVAWILGGLLLCVGSGVVAAKVYSCEKCCGGSCDTTE